MSNYKLKQTQELFCSNCNKKTKISIEIERDELNCNIKKPYCEECKNELIEYEGNFEDLFDEAVVRDIEKDYVFNPKKSIYEFQNNYTWLAFLIAFFGFFYV